MTHQSHHSQSGGRGRGGQDSPGDSPSDSGRAGSGQPAPGGRLAQADTGQAARGLTPGAASALQQAADRVRRALLAVTGVVVVADMGWAVVGDVRRPLPSFLVAAAATALLLASVWLVLARMVRSGPGLMVAWVAGGYLLRLVILAVALLGGRAAGLDATLVGVSLITGILAGMACETVLLAQARVPAAEPRPR